jgi:plasmid stability protein
MGRAGAPSAPAPRSRRQIISYVSRGELVRRGGGWEAAALTLTMISLEELLGQLLQMVFCSLYLSLLLSLIANVPLEGLLANLLVRGVDESVVKALKARAGEHGRSAEAEHREILAAALVQPHRRSFAEVLASMPEVGLDSDFERRSAATEAPRVFD